MLSDRFFKDKYMFAIYRHESEVLVSVCDNMQELLLFFKKHRYITTVSPSRHNIEQQGVIRCGAYDIYLIDISPHCDCFAEADEDFLRKVVKHRAMSEKEVMRRYSLSRVKSADIKRRELEEYRRYREWAYDYEIYSGEKK